MQNTKQIWQIGGKLDPNRELVLFLIFNRLTVQNPESNALNYQLGFGQLIAQSCLGWFGGSPTIKQTSSNQTIPVCNPPLKFSSVTGLSW